MKGIHELKRGIQQTGIAQEEREQDIEIMDKNICFCNLNLLNLVYQVPRCGRVLAST